MKGVQKRVTLEHRICKTVEAWGHEDVEAWVHGDIGVFPARDDIGRW